MVHLGSIIFLLVFFSLDRPPLRSPQEEDLPSFKPPDNNSNPAMTSLRSFLARASVLTMVFLRTCHGFYVPGVRPYEFAPGEEVPMKVNALTSIHTQVRIWFALYEALTLLVTLWFYLFISTTS